MATTTGNYVYPDHGTVYPARQTTADTVPGQILELCYYLMAQKPKKCTIDPDFISKKILINIELPIRRSIEGEVIKVSTSDIFPIEEGDGISVGQG